MIVRVYEYTDEQKEAFIEGWKKAGGYVGDLDSPYPWTYRVGIEVDAESDDPAIIGAAWWKECAAEVAQELKETNARR
jgi:hypothetical protein